MSGISAKNYLPRAAYRMKKLVNDALEIVELQGPQEWSRVRIQQQLNMTLDEIQVLKEVILKSQESEDVNFVGPDLFTLIMAIGQIKKLLKFKIGFPVDLKLFVGRKIIDLIELIEELQL